MILNRFIYRKPFQVPRFLIILLLIELFYATTTRVARSLVSIRCIACRNTKNLFNAVSIMEPETRTENDVVIIGAGIGGLATAARLGKAGVNVLVLEKNCENEVGGRVNELKLFEDMYRFDTGPSLLLLPHVLSDTFKELGYNFNDLVKIKRVFPAYKVYFSDGTDFTFSENMEDVKIQLEKIEPGSFEAYKDYLKYAQLNLDVGWPNFIEETFKFEKLWEFILSSIKYSPFQSHHDHLKRRFKNPKIQALLSFQDLYVGLTPYSAPAVFSLLQAIELNEGVYYPIGGFHNIAKALYKICKDLGVQFKFNTPVNEIVVSGKVYAYEVEGVLTDKNDLIQSDIVISNADLPFAELHLLPEPFRRKELKDAKYSSGIVAFYWACNKQWNQLSHHTLFLNTDYKGSWDRVFNGNKLESGFNFYCAAASRTDPSACPENHDAIMVLVPCPILPFHEDRSIDDEMEKWIEIARREVILEFEQTAGMLGFAESIVSEQVYSPKEWMERYNLERGAAFGLSHNLAQLSVFRPPLYHPIIDKLYFVGASTKPGNGIPLVLTGAKLVVEQVMTALKKK